MSEYIFIYFLQVKTIEIEIEIELCQELWYMKAGG